MFHFRIAFGNESNSKNIYNPYQLRRHSFFFFPKNPVGRRCRAAQTKEFSRISRCNPFLRFLIGIDKKMKIDVISTQ
jgi:hypothetical protein